MHRTIFQKLFVLLPALLLGIVTPVFADDDQLETDQIETLGIINAFQEQSASTSRFPRPTSKIAENVSVITADDIARLNAHTLADVLQTVPGIQLDYLRTPGSFSFFNLQGAHNTTVLVLIDGIRQNDFDQNMTIPGTIPVQQIERIEIIKGAASAAWGSALGGVINIITKTPDPERPVAGMVSGSTGSRFTADSRAELSGTIDRFGYYLTAGNLRSDGLAPNTATNQNNLYGKLSYTLPGNGTVTVGHSRLDSRPGLDEGDTAAWGFIHDNNVFHRNNSFIAFSQPLGSSLRLNMDGYLTNRDDHSKYGGRDDQGGIVFFNDYVARDSSRGINSRLTWGDGQQNLVTGVEYAHINARNMDLLSSDPPTYDLSWERWALYGNGAYTLGSLTLLPGIRYDQTGLSGNATSCTLGATYQLTDRTTLRAYAASGYSLSSPRFQRDKLQKIKTIQMGVESVALPYLWLKGTLFHNTLRNSQSTGDVVITNQNRQGFEIEARTAPLFDFSLTGGYTYLYAKNSDTGERLKTDSTQTVPPHLAKVALNYDNSDLGLRGTLTGSYVSWNSPEGFLSRSTGMIWDLHLNWKLKTRAGLTPELFISGHNLFNGVQTTDTEIYNAPYRWFEGGLRVNF